MTTEGDGNMQLAQCVEAALNEGKAQQVQRIDVRKLTTITDCMIVATGTSRTHSRALAERLVEQAKQQGWRVVGVEGLPAAEWVLVDLGEVVVHVMLSQIRSLYDLEELWSFKPGDREQQSSAK